MTEKKITNREVLNYMLKTYSNDQMVVDYATHQLELLDKKNANKTETETQKLNRELKEVVLEVLANCTEPVRIAQIQEKDERLSAQAGVSNQRLTNILTALKNDNKIVRTEEKRVAYFSLVK